MTRKAPLQRDFNALVATIEERLQRPFEHGLHANDHASYCLAAVKAMTGRLPIGRTRWTCAKGAQRVLKRMGGMKGFLDRHFVAIAPAMAMRGDIGGVADPELGIRPMIVMGDVLVGPGPNGQVAMPRRAMIAAWSATGQKKPKA